jgi:hypothetical protein
MAPAGRSPDATASTASIAVRIRCNTSARFTHTLICRVRNSPFQVSVLTEGTLYLRMQWQVAAWSRDSR